MREVKKLAIAISGASGVNLGLRLIEAIPAHIELFVVVSEGAKNVALSELGGELEELLDESRRVREFRFYDEDELDSPLASGSFGLDALAVVPTSLNCLAKIANGLCDDLISRCAAVMLKEGRGLLLAPREMPLSPIALRQMSELSALGVKIAPPIVGYYAKIESLEAMERFFVGKWLDVLGIENSLYQRWGSKTSESSVKTNPYKERA